MADGQEEIQRIHVRYCAQLFTGLAAAWMAVGKRGDTSQDPAVVFDLAAAALALPAPFADHHADFLAAIAVVHQRAAQERDAYTQVM